MDNLKNYTDQQLRDELKRRTKERQRPERCRECKYSGYGLIHKYGTYKTSVCLKKPKPQFGENRYYAIGLRDHACEMFDSKYSCENDIR